MHSLEMGDVILDMDIRYFYQLHRLVFSSGKPPFSDEINCNSGVYYSKTRENTTETVWDVFMLFS